MEEFLDIVKDTLIDGAKLLPFLFITFILMELLEHKFGDKLNNKLKKVNKIGPIFGSLLGIIPQCGISASASNFYITRVISLGTLISVYLSTSDEMLPILIGHNASIVLIVKILLVKFITGLVFGFIIDLIFRKKEQEDIKDFCELEDFVELEEVLEDCWTLELELFRLELFSLEALKEEDFSSWLLVVSLELLLDASPLQPPTIVVANRRLISELNLIPFIKHPFLVLLAASI